MICERLFFLVEGPGKALDLVKASIKERLSVQETVFAFVEKVGGKGYRAYSDGAISGVIFDGPPPKGWKAKTSRGTSFPKKGTDVIEEIANLPKLSVTSHEIARALGIPLQLQWKGADGSLIGFSCLALPLNECGFAYPSADGPYLLWIPDVPAAVEKASSEERGGILDPEIATWRPAFDGCRQITQGEWDFIIAKHRFESQKNGQTEVQS